MIIYNFFLENYFLGKFSIRFLC